MLSGSPEVETIFKNSSKEQWHWEVQSWFEVSLLIAKFGLLASVQGAKKGSSGLPDNLSSNSNWMCDKVLDNDPTSLSFIGLMATLSGLLVLCLLGAAGRLLVSIKHGLRS
jgi:hypothetical protein